MPATTGFEALLAEVLSRLRASTTADVDSVLPALARFFGAERVHFRHMRLDLKGWDRDHVFTELGTPLGAPRLERATAAGPSWLQRRLLAGDVVRVDRTAEPPAGLPAEALAAVAAEREGGVAALLEVPVRDARGAVVASLGLRRSHDAEPWTDGDAARLQHLGDVILLLLGAREPVATPELAELRRAAVLSERLQERLFAAMDVAAIGFFDWDIASDRVWYLSPFVGTRPYPRDTFETEGNDWFRATHPDDVALARADVDAAIAGRSDYFDTIVRMRLPHYGADGWFHVRSRGTVLGRDPGGRALRMVGVYEDVSEAVRHAAVERERELALEQATRSAALGTLATSLAHELNQPLAALTSFVQAGARLLDEGRPDEVKPVLQRSVDLAHRASEIIRRMRRLVQHRTPQLEPVDMQEVIGAVVELLRRDAKAAEVDLRVLPGAGPVVVGGDRIQLEQVMVNVIRNAIEATAARDGGGRLVRVEARAGEGHVEVRVDDTGPGIRTDVLERLFEPFVTSKAGGTGLGLTISRSILEAHGGALRVERTGPEGTRIVVTLPVGGASHGDD